MNTPMKPSRRFYRALLCAWALLFAAITTLHAGSATWNLNPTSSDWNIAANWTPETVPNGPDDTATFALSNNPEVRLTGDIEVNNIVFTPDAGSFSFTTEPIAGTLNFTGAGIENDSGRTHSFLAQNSSEGLAFYNQATAGDEMTFTVKNLSWIAFFNQATAGTATFFIKGNRDFEDGDVCSVTFHNNSTAGIGTFINTGGSGEQGDGGVTVFVDDSTAADGNFTNTAATTLRAYTGGRTIFVDNSTAGNALITNEGGSSNDDPDDAGAVHFFDMATAGSATLIANSGSNGGEGGRIEFSGTADGGTARVELFGNGTLDISASQPNLTIGSLEGSGNVHLGSNTLTTGANDLTTTFSGVIDGAGSLHKVGRGQLTLSGGNTYTGRTIVSAGTLLLEINGNSSQTGTGKVVVTAGTIGGNGLVAGTLTIGNGRGLRATLSPSVGDIRARILKTLTFKSDGDYNWQVNSTDLTTGTVEARGVGIVSGAQLLVSDIGTATIPVGTVLTVISNLVPTPISGTFSNLPDGGTITVGSNTFQANYEGGDGNDLTLTVVQ